MNIGFDAAAMFAPSSKNRGIGNYSVSLFSTIINNDKENNYFLLNCIENTSFKTYLDGSVTNFNEEILYSGKDCAFINNEYSEIYGDIIRTFIEKNNIDVFIITSPIEYIVAPIKREWFGKAKVYCIVYDIIPYVMSSHYLSDSRTRKIYMERINRLKEYDRLLVISKSVKDDLVSHLGLSADTIDVIYGAFDSHFKKIEISESDKKALFDKFKVRDNFIMCTGGDDYRKNIEGLIEAYAKLPKKLILEHQLVIVCKMCEASVKRYTKLINDLKIRSHVILTNFVSTEELIQFYNLAHLMAFPSKYEGFGLPVVEAWACGTPVLTSNNSSLGEIAGDGAVVVDPFNIKDITRGLEYALTEANLNEMLKIGQKRNEEIFNWKNVALLTIDSLNRAELTKEENEEQRPRIAIFTPLPPIESGISDYSDDIIRSLSTYFDIDVFIDDGYKTTTAFPENVKVYNHKAYLKMNALYKDTVYQVGNSNYHVYMYDYIEKYSGTVVLHDFNMNGVALYLKSIGKQELYKKFLYADFDEKDARMIASYGASTEMPFNGIVINPAKKIIVHDKYSKNGILDKCFGKRVFIVPLYAKPENIPEDTESIRAKYGYKKDDVIFSAFGLIAPSKRIMPLVTAFERFARDNPSAKLLLCGKQIEAMGSTLNDFIKEHGLKDKVKITGYIELDDFVNYIDICDVCFNLRYPYNGESSASLTRILAKCKPVVVNRIGSFDSVPDSACIKLQSVEHMTEEEETDSIYNVMTDYIEAPEKYAEIAKNGRKYAEEELDIKKVSEQYYNAIMESDRYAINRELGKDIVNVVNRSNYTLSEIEALAHTFAYSKNEVI